MCICTSTLHLLSIPSWALAIDPFLGALQSQSQQCFRDEQCYAHALQTSCCACPKPDAQNSKIAVHPKKGQ